MRLAVLGYSRGKGLSCRRVRGTIQGGAGTVIYARTSGLAKGVVGLGQMKRVTSRGRVLFIISTSRATNICPVSIRRLKISMLYFAKRGNLLKPRKAKKLCIERNIRVHPLLYKKDNISACGVRRPSRVPATLRTKALGKRKVTKLNTTVSCLGHAKVSIVHRGRLRLVHEFCSKVSRLPSIGICKSFATRRETPVIAFGLKSCSSSRIDSRLGRICKVTAEPKTRYTPLVRGTLNAMRRKTIHFDFSRCGARRRISFTVHTVGRLWEGEKERGRFV